MSITGKTHLIPHFKYRRAPKGPARDPKVMRNYDKRALLLSSLGYTNYAQYLASAEWATIRARVLSAGPVCVMCDKPSAVVHHVKYWDTVLLGLQDSCLAPLCHRCHEQIEVPDGKKSRMGSANTALFAAASKTAHGRDWAKAYHKGLVRECGRRPRA